MDEFYEMNDIYYNRLGRNEQVKKSELIFKPPNKSLLESSEFAGLLENDLLKFYKLNDGMLMEWTTDPDSNKAGRLKILALEHFIGGIKTQLPYLTPNDDLFFFHPLDLFVDEASCGVFIRNGKIEDRMFYNFQGEDEVFDLQIGFYGYLLLAIMARGYYYWPKYLIELINGKSSPESEKFKKEIPQVFTDFNLNDFKAKFESLRIK